MPKKANHTKCKRITQEGQRRRRNLHRRLKSGSIGLKKFLFLMDTSLRNYLSLRKKGEI